MLSFLSSSFRSFPNFSLPCQIGLPYCVAKIASTSAPAFPQSVSSPSFLKWLPSKALWGLWMEDKRQMKTESERLMNLLHYQTFFFFFALCGTSCLWAFIPPSLHPSLCFFSPSDLIMRELYRPRQISVSLPHITNNRRYHERRRGRIICTLLTNRSHLLGAGVCVFITCVL